MLRPVALPEIDVTEAFAAETRRVMARRVPMGVLCCFVGIVSIAGLMEVSYYPARFAAFATSLLAELALYSSSASSRKP